MACFIQRLTWFTMLIHLPREEGYRLVPPTKSRPTLPGYRAVTLANTLTETRYPRPRRTHRSATERRRSPAASMLGGRYEQGVDLVHSGIDESDSCIMSLQT